MDSITVKEDEKQTSRQCTREDVIRRGSLGHILRTRGINVSLKYAAGFYSSVHIRRMRTFLYLVYGT